jgi:peptidoglycan/xylan/chitin deacetylase (PgdA/CDA1 family)
VRLGVLPLFAETSAGQQPVEKNPPALLRRPIPDHLVVLTFDDAPRSQAIYAAPILKHYGFGATFFICEFPPHFQDKSLYMSWTQIQQLDKDGFEIGNHTAFHTHVSKMTRAQFSDSLDYIEKKCKSLGISKPVTFAYPGYDVRSKDLDLLTGYGYLFARAGGERPYNPVQDNALLVPGINANGTDANHVIDALKQASGGKIVVLTFHGIPDKEHPWVSTPPELFKKYMQYLHKNQYTVIAMRDLSLYVDPAQAAQLNPPVKSNESGSNQASRRSNSAQKANGAKGHTTVGGVQNKPALTLTRCCTK